MEVDVRLAQLEQQTGTIQRDVAEIKADLRRLDGKIDAVKDSVGSLTVKVATIESKLGAMEDRFDAKFEAMETRFDAKLSAMESAMIKWMVGTLIAAVALAFAVAKFIDQA